MDNEPPQMKIPVEQFREFLRKSPAEIITASHHESDLVRYRNGLGETLLHWWAIEYDCEWVSLYQRLGADLNTIDDFGGTPLMSACYISSHAMMHHLLSLGGDAGYISAQGESALSKAATAKNLEACRVLLPLLRQGIQDYFNDCDAYMVCGEDNPTSAFLIAAGLRDPWIEHGDMNRP